MKQIIFAAITICILFNTFIKNSYSDDRMDRYRKNENISIQATGGKVTRIDDKSLKLKLNTGKEIILNDKISHPDDDEQVRYVFRGIDSKLGGYLFDIWYWEDFDILLVQFNDGVSQVIPDIPFFNPSKNKFLCIESSPLYPTEIHIYSINHSKLEKEYYYISNDWGAENPKWLSNTELSIDTYHFKRDTNGNEIKEIDRIYLKYFENKWKIVNKIYNKS